MKSYLLFTGNEQKVIITSHNSVEDHGLLKKLKSKGIAKFIAYEVSIESVREKYGKCFDIFCNNLGKIDDLMLLDYFRGSSLNKFSFFELSNPTFLEPEKADAVNIYMVGV